MSNYQDETVIINGEEHVVLNEDIDQMPKLKNIKKITTMWNNGYNFLQIGKRMNCDPDLVLIILIHQARRDQF